MLTISLQNATKYWHKQPFTKVLDNINYCFNQPHKYVIYGLNGSGKSTLLKIITGIEGLSSGKIEGSFITQKLPYINFAVCAPWIEIMDELSAVEFLAFHFNQKPIKATWTIDRILDLLKLSKLKNHKIKTYSSGMIQKLKWSQALFSDVSCLLLDEPFSNLDESSQDLLKEILNTQCSNQLVILATNTTQELTWGNHRLHLDEGQLKPI